MGIEIERLGEHLWFRFHDGNVRLRVTEREASLFADAIVTMLGSRCWCGIRHPSDIHAKPVRAAQKPGRKGRKP